MTDMDWVYGHLVESLLMQYSERLDVENNLPINAQDERTQEVLVREFITQRNPGARLMSDQQCSWRGYEMPWTRTYAEWNWDDRGWYPTTADLEPWPSYLRRIGLRLWARFNFKGAS